MNNFSLSRKLPIKKIPLATCIQLLLLLEVNGCCCVSNRTLYGPKDIYVAKLTPEDGKQHDILYLLVFPRED